jgi:hypothetical protein
MRRRTPRPTVPPSPSTRRRGPDRRVIAAVAVLVAFGAVIGVTQISNADESKTVACEAPAADRPATNRKGAATDPKVGTYTDKNGNVQHKGDGQLAKGERAPKPTPVQECRSGATTKKQVNGLGILANSCDDSRLEPHDGFQKGDRCVSTEFGEVGSAENNPTLLITDFPRTVPANTPFTFQVSTRNLIRDRFLAAGQGGYYVESSLLQGGLVRGHFHSACRMLASTDEAPDPAPVPAFFVATEDKQGGATPDTVTIRVPGLPEEGTAQCASWAGDGSHRIPMMQRANQTPAFDSVRIKVRGGNQEEEEEEEPPANPAPTPSQSAGNGDNNGGDNGNDGDGNGGNGDGNGGNGDGNDGDNNGNDGGDNGNDGGDNGGDNGDGDDAPTPGATATPKTNTGTKPPLTGTVTIPPKASKPASSSNDSSSDDSSSDDASDSSDSSEDETQTATGRTAKPSPSKKPAATRDSSEQPAVETVPDDGAPDPTLATDVQTADDSDLALTGANSVTIMLGGGLLVLCGLLLLGASRRRRAAQRD